MQLRWLGRDEKKPETTRAPRGGVRFFAVSVPVLCGASTINRGIGTLGIVLGTLIRIMKALIRVVTTFIRTISTRITRGPDQHTGRCGIYAATSAPGLGSPLPTSALPTGLTPAHT